MELNHRNRIYSWLLLGALALAGCQERSKVTAASIECRARPPASEVDLKPSSSDYGMAYKGFRLGESARDVEARIAQHPGWTGVSLMDCNGSWHVSAGTAVDGDRGAMCNVRREEECEKVAVMMEETTTGSHVLRSLSYSQRFEGNGRPTQGVLDDFKEAYGEPSWSYAIRRSPGWPDLAEETSLIWSAHSDNMRRPVPDTNFQEQAIHQLGAGDYLIVRLTHHEDHRVTYGIKVDLRRVSAASIPNRRTTQGSK
jgi:hypothetical protein